MKLLTHCFSRAIVSAFLDSQTVKSSNNFELMAALMAQRWCEAMWEMPTMICYYMKEKYHHELLKDARGKIQSCGSTHWKMGSMHHVGPLVFQA